MTTRFHTPGSIWIELALWIMFFPAGIIYSLWRWTSRKPVLQERNVGVDVVHTWNGEQPPQNMREGSLWYSHLGANVTIYQMKSGAWWRLGH